MFEMYKRVIDYADFRQVSEDAVGDFLDRISLDESLTSDEYCTLYDMAVNKYKESFERRKK